MSVQDNDFTAEVIPRLYSSKKSSLPEEIPLSTPYSVHMDICSICNFRCSYCFQADRDAKKQSGLVEGRMSMELFKKIIDDLKEFDEPIKKIKIGNNGEPLLHKDFPEMVEYIKNSKVTDIIEVFTNGSKLNQNLNNEIIDAGLDIMNISLQGLTEERYLQVAGAKINMKNLIDNIAHLYSIKKQCKIYVKVIDKASPLDKDDNRQFIFTEEDRKYFFSTFGNICDEIFVEKVAPQWPEAQLEKQNKNAKTGIFGQEINKEKDICGFTFMYLCYTPFGLVHPCMLDWANKLVIGDAHKETAKEIWNGNKLRDLRIAMTRGQRSEIDVCSDCNALSVCMDDDLDNHKDKIYKVYNVTEKEINGPNQWIINE